MFNGLNSNDVHDKFDSYTPPFERGDFMNQIGVPYDNKILGNCPAYICEPEPDEKAYGVRDKNERFREIVGKILDMTADCIHWDLSEILPDMPPTTIEQYTQSAGWSALIRKNGKFHLVSGVCAGFRGEYDEYFLPVGVIVSNPYSKDKIDGEYTFGVDAVLLRNDTAMQGLFPIICPRAEMLVENDISILVGLNNLRIINMFHAATDNMRQAAERFIKLIRWGRIGVILGKDSRNKWSGAPDNPVIENLPNGGVPANYMIQFIETASYIRGALYNDLGLQYNSNMKREALNDSETTMNDDILHPFIDNMIECRKRFCEECKKVFGIDIPEPQLFGAWARRQEQAEKATEETPEEQTEETTETESEAGENDEMQNADTD